MEPISLERARAAKKAAIRRFSRLKSITGVGLTRVDGRYAVKLNVSRSIPRTMKVPAAIDGVPLRIEVTGTIRAK